MMFWKSKPEISEKRHESFDKVVELLKIQGVEIEKLKAGMESHAQIVKSLRNWVNSRLKISTPEEEEEKTEEEKEIVDDGFDFIRNPVQ